MSSRRVPLSANPNVANSPLRGAAASLAAPNAKQRRSYASTQREDAYGQPPPAKRQMLDPSARTALRSPTKSKTLVQRGTSRSLATERVSQSTSVHKPSEKEVEEVRKWQQSQRSRFPKLVFYFESIPDEQRVKLAKQVAHLGAREAKFFSIDITHVVTSRSIPPERPTIQKEERVESAEVEDEQPQTINPSLLHRSADAVVPTTSLPTKRRLFETATSRRMPLQAQDEAVRRPKPTTSRNADVLHRAREMGKKIWSLEKLQKVLDMLIEPDPYRSAALGFGSRGTAAGASRITEESTLLQLLNKERVNGPSDRDPTVATRELSYFKGPYIYVYDIEEKQKPIMVREYNKVADKKHGDWPQFRASSTGRCPFVEDYETAAEKKERQRMKEAAAKPAVESAPRLQPPVVEPPRAVTGKRSLAEMEDGQNRRPPATVQPTEVFDAAKAAMAPSVDFQPQNAFTSRAKTGLFFAGEPVASGVQPSGITSAIRSQMISSATGTLGSRAGTSKEIHGLQRKVLQKSAPTSQDLSSRRMTENSMDPMSYTRSQSLGRATHRKLDVIDDQSQSREEKHKRTQSVPVQAAKQKKRDPKPGYCENCQDKFDDFDDHILSRKHRRFAENDDNWTHLDALLSQLKRIPKHEVDGDDDGW